MVKILLISALIALASAQTTVNELCEDKPVQQEFAMSDYLGLWFDYAKYPSIFEFAGKCGTSEYTLRPDGNLGVRNKEINRLTGTTITTEGYAMPDPTEPAKLGLVYPNQPEGKVAPYWVLGTDYLTYSVVWGCTNINETSSRQTLNIITRDRLPSDAVVNKAIDFCFYSIQDSLKFVNMVKILLISALIAVASAQVTVNEICDNKLVQQSFSINDYLGFWYDYAKYPTTFEIGGKCGTAEYTLRSDGNLGVKNKQINRITGSTITIEGYATPDPQEPAKLGLFFPTVPSGRVAPYWVMGTDYESYSVVWGCTNINETSSRQTLYIITRDRIPTEFVINEAMNVIRRNDINAEPLRKTIQDSCP
uniref:Apolipoprotein D n=1 Tax=Culicoides sonorensis TaxID=179676 RepID=A0A336M7D4_CULSO